MQDILKEYGPAIITLVVTVALITVLTNVVGSDTVKNAFSGLLQQFYDAANEAGGIAAATP